MCSSVLTFCYGRVPLPVCACVCVPVFFFFAGRGRGLFRGGVVPNSLPLHVADAIGHAALAVGRLGHGALLQGGERKLENKSRCGGYSPWQDWWWEGIEAAGCDCYRVRLLVV